MKKIISLLSAAAVFSALAAAPKASQTVLSGQKAVILENNVLKLTAVPGTMGAIAKLRYLPGNSELFNDYKYTCTVINELLPEQKTVTFWGNRTLIWNGTVLFYQPLSNFKTVSDKNAVQLDMSGKFIGGFPIEMTRKVTLEKDSAVIKIAVTISNFGKKEEEIRLWEHLVPNPENSLPDVSLISGKGVRRLGRYQDTEKSDGGLIVDTFKDANLNRFIVPGGNWIAATGGKTPLTVFLRTDAKNLDKDGFFYTQKNAVSKLHTVEVLLKRLYLAPGKSSTVELEMGVLSHLKTLRYMTQNYGFDFEHKGNTLLWHASALRNMPAKKIVFKLGKVQKEFTVPALVPGKSVSGKLEGSPAFGSNSPEFTEK